MAQQKAEEGLGEPHPDKEERKPVILKEDEKKKQTGGETSKVKEGQKDATSKGTKKSSAVRSRLGCSCDSYGFYLANKKDKKF